MKHIKPAIGLCHVCKTMYNFTRYDPLHTKKYCSGECQRAGTYIRYLKVFSKGKNINGRQLLDN